MTAGPIGLLSRVLKLALVAVGAIAVLLSAAASAGADASASVSFHGHLRGKAFFEAGLNDFKICDKRKDNLPVAVRYSFIQRGGKAVRDTQWHTAGVEGAGRPAPGHRGQFIFGCSYANVGFIGTNQPVWLQACVRHESGSLQCGKVNKTTAR
jgi:hypothetical protein